MQYRLRLVRNILIVLLTVLFVVVLIGFCTYLILRVSSKEAYVEKETYSYQHVVVNPSSNETSFGILTSYQNFVEKRPFYEDSMGNLHLVSEFGEDEYECTGLCFCEGSERRYFITLSQSVKFLVAAVSSMAAYHLAVKFLLSDCVDKFYEICEPDNIQTEVDGCAMLAKKNKKKQTKAGVVDDTVEKIFTKKKGGRMRYICKGNCLPRIDLAKDKRTELNIFNGRVKFTEKFRLLWVQVSQGRTCIKFSLEKQARGKTEFEAADRFLQNSLHPYCTQVPEAMHNFQRKDGSFYQFNLCSGWGIKAKEKANYGPIERNRSIKCRILPSE